MQKQTKLDFKNSSALVWDPNHIRLWEYPREMDPVSETEAFQTSDVAF